MLRTDENQIIKIIQYTPLFILLLTSIIITFLIYTDYKKTIQKEKIEATSTFIQEHKKSIKQNVQTAINYTQREFNSTETKLKKKLREELLNAKAIISTIYRKNKNTKTKEEITNLVKNVLSNYRFNDGRGYFYINQMNGIRVFHPIFPEKEGEDISFEKDILGEIRFQKVKRIIEEKQKGFETFYFYNPNKKEEQQEKLTYVEYFEPYDWMIGTGEYVKEFEKNIQKKVLQYLKDIDIGEGKNYFVLDYNGSIIQHPNAKILNKNIFKEKDLEYLIPFFKKIKENIKFAEGFFSSKYNLNLQNEKIGNQTYFFKTFPRWEWIILTSFNEKNIKQKIYKKQSYLDNKYTKYLNTIILISIILTSILMIISFYISKILERKFKKYREKLQKEISKNIVQKNKLLNAQEVAKIGDWELNPKTMEAIWSKQIFKILGLKDKPKVVGPNFLKNVIVEEDWNCFETSLANTLNSGQMHKCQYRIKRPDGEIRWIECRGNYNKEKNVVNGVIQDITENKLLEIEKHQKEEIIYQQSKLAAMGEMIGNIAHQWRQPLSTISTASTGAKLQKELGVLSDKEFINSMNTINNSVQYLSQTIDDFRYFFSPTHRKSYFELNETIDKTLNLITAQFTAKDIEIIKDIKNLEINSLENEFIQVLINILNNARDALLETKEIRRLIIIKIYKVKEFINIEIQDNAGGIEESIINRVFEPYFTTKHKSQGTGIGLYMSEEIVTKHLNGTIMVQNTNFVYEGEKYIGANFKISTKDLVD